MSVKKQYLNRSISLHIPLHIYPFDVLVSFNQEDAGVEKLLAKAGVSKAVIKEEKHTYGENGGAKWVIYRTGSPKVLIRMRKLPETSWDYSALHHEIFHAVAAILEYVGMELLVGTSDEAYAYLISYITKEIYTSINKYYN